MLYLYHFKSDPALSEGEWTLLQWVPKSILILFEHLGDTEVTERRSVSVVHQLLSALLVTIQNANTITLLMMQGAAFLCIYKVRPYVTQVDNNLIKEQCQSNNPLAQVRVILLHEISKRFTVN